jgi:hypothetical protein
MCVNRRTVLEKRQITTDLLHQISISMNEEQVFLTVDFMDGKFMIEKVFKNSFIGLIQMNEECEKLNDEAKVFRYLRIGAENGK